MNIKYLIAASAAALIAATAANAADIVQPAPYEPAPVVTVPTFSWTGAYVGGQIGGTWSDSNVKSERNIGFLPVGYTQGVNWSPDGNGFVGGLYAGYNFEVGNNIVLGAETDFVWGDVKDSYSSVARYGIDPLSPYNYNSEGNIKQKWAGATRVRVGYAMDRFMPYVAGGVAYTKVDTNGRNYLTSANPASLAEVPGSSLGYSTSNTMTGWTIGAGVDYAVTDNVLVRLEYRYADYGDKTNTYTHTTGQTFKEKIDYKSNDVRVGVAYKF
ncbi:MULTISPECIES: outer membrane protein [unclassified Bartonella]|uniref:outer membrane protein n=1 Tax=unclassified Bartonella TaxID=2645622 RepID=UPI0015FA5853|nr:MULTISPECIES: outer membrane protein [unclassified Bartonella]UXN03411.1 porin family protein [Bartonella sp. HY406]UXN06370.1 porin family protein [Bartonella sp. HY761]